MPSTRASSIPAASPPAAAPRTRQRRGQSSPSSDLAPSAQQQPLDSTLPPPPIRADARVVLSSERLENLPCFDRASIGAAFSVNPNRVWLPEQEVYLGSLSRAEATVQLAPLATSFSPVPNAENFYAALARSEAIEYGTEGDASRDFRAHLGKRVVAECVIRLAHSAGLLKEGDGCVVLPTVDELEARLKGSGSSAGASAGTKAEERQGEESKSIREAAARSEDVLGGRIEAGACSTPEPRVSRNTPGGDNFSGNWTTALQWNSPSRMLVNVGRTATVRLGDGISRVKAGEPVRRVSPEHGRVPSTALRWTEWLDGDLAGLSEGEHRPSLSPAVRLGQTQNSTSPDAASPDAQCDTRNCYFVGSGREMVESRRISFSANGEVIKWGECVVVVREGLALPKRTLLEIVNTVYATLVVRGESLHYLNNDFALSAEEEDSLVEWGIERPVLGGMFLAMLGFLLVWLAEQVWRPAIVGILLVGAAQYRIQGALSSIIRISSDGWKRHDLVPNGVHGAERLVQSILLTTLAVADLLDSREALLVGLFVATLQVVLLEIVGQIVITWGLHAYLFTLLKTIRLCVTACVAWIIGGFFWYVFAGGFAIAFTMSLLLWVFFSSRHGDLSSPRTNTIAFIPLVVALPMCVLDCIGLELRICLSPWKWPFTEMPDNFRDAVRLPGLWIAAGSVHCLFAASMVMHVVWMKVKSDRLASAMVGVRGSRSAARKKKDHFKHYSVSSIPSRNLLHQVDGDIGSDTGLDV
ncbi:unnamed protein product [Ectocarpus fasciculatus]